jgi:hypothetical protein
MGFPLFIHMDRPLVLHKLAFVASTVELKSVFEERLSAANFLVIPSP